MTIRAFFTAAAALATAITFGVPGVYAQEQESAEEPAVIARAEPAEPEAIEPESAQRPAEQIPGFTLPDSDRLRIRLDFMAGYGHDGANASLGFEKQGRVGYGVVTLEGRFSRRVSYRLAVNPVDETSPLPACGEENFFYPNDPAILYGAGPNVPCDHKNGARRVDGYRGIALDVVSQQGPIREAWLDFRLTEGLTARFGRTLLPIGFGWEKSGSFTAKDAPRIQRINAESNFGAMFSYARRVPGRTRPTLSANVAGFLGEGNRWYDYDYFYFEDGSLDANSALTALVSGSFSPADSVELRAAVKKGYTGSKVERLPSYWASKRNDDAFVVGTEYQPVRFARVVGEWARYEWGLTATSAALVGAADQSPVVKTGYWLTGEAWQAVGRNLTLGGSVSREEVDRADSLVRYAATNDLFGVEEGKKDRMTVIRFYADIAEGVRIGFYKNLDSNPYPWLSGIWPVAGPRAMTGSSTDKWGMIVSMKLR